MQDRLVIGQPDRTQIRSLPSGLARKIGVLANEWGRLVGFAGEVEMHLVRCLGIGHIRAPMQKSRFDPQRVKRLAAGKTKA